MMTLFLSLFLFTFPIFSHELQLSHKKTQSTVHCGVSAFDTTLNGSVVGFRNVEPGEVPFYVPIMAGGKFMCDGVLIADRWVLTTAYCTLNIEFVGVRFVLSDKSNKTIRVESIYDHPEFDMKTLNNNIALLLLEEPVEFNDNIQPICLPEPGEDETFYGLNGTEVNMGIIVPNVSEYFPKIQMQITTVSLIKYDECKTYYKGRSDDFNMNDSILCAGYQGGDVDFFKSESGGPLMVNTKGYWILAGICEAGIPFLPGIYTRVGYFLNWITTTIADPSKATEVRMGEKMYPAFPKKATKMEEEMYVETSLNHPLYIKALKTSGNGI